jgi:ferredoxin
VILQGGSRETRNTPYKSEDCEDGRGDVARAAPGCPFDSIDAISFNNMMKRE